MSSGKSLALDKQVPRFLNAQAAAKLFGVSHSTVGAWLDEGMPNVSRAGKQRAAVQLDLLAIAPWIASRRATKPDAARVTVAVQQAEKLRLENARSRRELIPASELQLVLHEATAAMVQGCEAMPHRVSANAEVQAKVRDECRTLRSTFADALEALAPN